MSDSTEAPRLGVHDIDAEHELLLDLVRAIEKAAPTAPRPEVEPLFRQLVEYTRAHFATEEVLMRFHAYPDFGAHQLEHARLMEQVSRIAGEFRAGSLPPTAAFAGALRHWFLEHVRTHDAALARFLRAASPGVA